MDNDSKYLLRNVNLYFHSGPFRYCRSNIYTNTIDYNSLNLRPSQIIYLSITFDS